MKAQRLKKIMLFEKGVALIMVLWLLTLLTIMATSFALGMRRETRLIAHIRDKAQAIAIAEAGITIAQLNLLTVDKQLRWQASGHIYPLSFNKAKIRIRIESESGKIAINQADETLLIKMMLQTDVEESKHQAIINAILDWRDSDDLIRLDGAEAATYQAAGLLYQPGNKPFQTIEELRLVFGITAELFEQLKTMISVYSTQMAVELKTANKKVLLATTGLDAEIIDNYISQRVDHDKKQLPPPLFPHLGKKQSKVNTQKIYTLIAEAQLNNGAKARVQVVLQKNVSHGDTPFVILDWKRYADLKQSLFSKDMAFLLITQDAEFNY